MRKKEEISYLEDMDALEPYCMAMRVRSTIIYCYPPTEKVLEQKPKVVLSDGRVVKHVQLAIRDGERVIVGELDEERLVWDLRGKLIGDEYNDDMQLLVPERYFMRDWRSHIKMSNGEFAIRYQRPHPHVEIPEPKIREI